MGKSFQKIMHYVGQHGIVRPRDKEAIGLQREYLVRLHRQGKLNRPGRGIYTLPDAQRDGTPTLNAEVEPVAYRRSSRPKRERVRRLNFRESLGISSAAHSILGQDI